MNDGSVGEVACSDLFQGMKDVLFFIVGKISLDAIISKKMIGGLGLLRV